MHVDTKSQVYVDKLQGTPSAERGFEYIYFNLGFMSNPQQIRDKMV